MSITGSSSIRRLKDCPVVVGLDNLAPVGRRATGGREGRWFEWFAEVCQDLPDRPRIGDECDQPDVAAAGGARKWKVLPHPRHELGPGDPRGVVRAGLLIRVIRVTAASRGMLARRMSTDRIPASRGIASLADIPDR